MKYSMGIDVGGTFTDFLLVDETGFLEAYKVLSTSKDPSIAVFNGLHEIAEAKGLHYREFLRQIQIVSFMEQRSRLTQSLPGMGPKQALSQPKASGMF